MPLISAYGKQLVTFTRPGTPAPTDPFGTPTDGIEISVLAVVTQSAKLFTDAQGRTVSASIEALCPPVEVAVGDTLTYQSATYTVLAVSSVVHFGRVVEVKVYG